jgi:hypothetical protein
MILAEGSDHYRPTTWDAAFKLIGKTVNCLGSPNHAAFYTSGKTSNKAAFLYQLSPRQFGTNNLPDCSNTCHESSGCALLNMIGVGKGTVSLEDFESGRDLRHRPEPGHQPSSHAHRLQRPSNAVARSPASMCFQVGLMRFTNPQDFAAEANRRDSCLPKTLASDLGQSKPARRDR